MHDNHGEQITPEEALQWISMFAANIPNCPSCGRSAYECGNWVKLFILQAIHIATDPLGPIAFFTAVCRKFADESGNITINEADLDRANKGTGIALTKERDLGIYHILIDDGLPEEKECPSTGNDEVIWPSIIGG